MWGIRVFDNFVADPAAYRRAALGLEYRDFRSERGTFRGIAIPAPPDVPARLMRMFPGLTPTLSFFRKSPEGQTEPHFIHTDTDMGEWTALLYLNPLPPTQDGTTFWIRMANGARESPVPGEYLDEGKTTDGWKPWRRVPARFNRLVIFPAAFFHSRSIEANWGAGDEARLAQVVFGKGQIWQ